MALERKRKPQDEEEHGQPLPPENGRVPLWEGKRFEGM
jgi:hypothetical protein